MHQEMDLPALMTVQEVAEYLRLKERKVYDLVAQRRIPCTRVSGKWLFPRAQIDLWLLQNSEWSGPDTYRSAPAVLVGSHDPLLEWVLREAGAPFAMQIGGSVPGLQRFADGGAVVCGLHVPDPDSGAFNLPLVTTLVKGQDIVVLQWALRQQGLVLAPGNPLHIATLEDLVDRGARLIERQEGSGSRILLLRLLEQAGVPRERIHVVTEPAHSETDVGLAVLAGKADCGLAIEATARQLKLDFLPLTFEYFDLVIRRRDYFEPPFQRLLRLATAPMCSSKAAEMGGYDLSGLGTVRYNDP